MVNHYHRFILKIADTDGPLYDYMTGLQKIKKKSRDPPFEWSLQSGIAVGAVLQKLTLTFKNQSLSIQKT